MILNFYKSETYKTLQKKEKGLWKDFNAFRIKRCTIASDYVILYTHCIVERRGISQISGFRSGQRRSWYRMKKILKRTGKVFCLFLLIVVLVNVLSPLFCRKPDEKYVENLKKTEFTSETTGVWKIIPAGNLECILATLLRTEWTVTYMSHNLFSKFVQQLKKSLSIGPQKIKIDIKAAITTVVDVKEEKLLWT